MSNEQLPAARASVTEVTSALICGGIAAGGAIALPFLAAAEPDAGIPPVAFSDASWWIAVAFIAAQAAALLWAKRSPRIVLALILLVPLIHALFIPGATLSLMTVGVSFAVFWVVLRGPRGTVLLLAAAALVVALSQTVNEVRGGAALDLLTLGAAGLQALVVVGIPAVIALFFAARADARASRGNELVALERERDALVQAAVSRERVAMSRELHDIAAHHLSGIALQASAIYRQVDLDPEAAKIAAQQVRAQSTSVLDDLRRVIGLLRDDAESIRSVETLAALPDLVEVRRAAGLKVTLSLLAGNRELGEGIGPLAQLVAYRMVQEALSNVAVHAPGATCAVEVDDRRAARLSVVVTNTASPVPDPGPGGGFGLVGMRERADLVGAELHAGPTEGGGWQVRLTLPRELSSDSESGEPR